MSLSWLTGGVSDSPPDPPKPNPPAPRVPDPALSFVTPRVPRPTRPPRLDLSSPLVPSALPSTSRFDGAASSLPFLEPYCPDHGITSSLHPSLFGGLQFASVADGSAFVPQYNVAAFWKRPYIGGREWECRPSIGPRLLPGPLSRPPGEFPYDVPEGMRRWRNLVAARHLPHERKVEVWTVSERSKRKLLERWTAKVDVQGRTRRWKTKEERKMTKAVDELRMTTFGGGRVAVRTSDGIDLVLPDEMDTTVKIWSGGNRSWTESPWIEGELAVVDARGLICTGSADTGFVKIECTLRVDGAVYTEHPRVLLAASGKECRLVDTRCARWEEDCPSIFTIPSLYVGMPNEPLYVGKLEPDAEDERICHIASIRGWERASMVVSPRGLYVVDERAPGRALLSSLHPLRGGPDVVDVAPPLETTVGTAHGITFLSHVLPQVLEWRILRHHSGILSSVEVLRRLAEPPEIWEQGPTRAVTTLSITPRCQIRIRQTENGAVWTERITGEGEEAEEDEALRDYGWWADEEPWIEQLAEELKQKARIDVAIVDGRPRKRREKVEEMEKRMERLQRTAERGWIVEEGGEEEDEVDDKKPGSEDEETLTLSVYSSFTDHAWEETRAIQEQIPVKAPPMRLKEREKGTTLTEEEIVGDIGSSGRRVRLSRPHSILSDGVHYDEGNLAQTYSALICLCIVGDDLKRVNRQAILTSIRKCQMEKGCFSSQSAGSEHDMRFVFCAVAICYILGDDSAIDWKKLAEFIRGAVAYDGGIGQTPGDESHGGSTYCAVASLALANRLWDGSVLDEAQLKKLVRWAVLKQERGFHGRANKEDDSCYGFWIGGTLEILNSHSLIGHSELRSFLHEVQHPALGGFCKLAEAGKHPGTIYIAHYWHYIEKLPAVDNLHTYFSLAALSLLREPGIAPVFAPLNCSRRVHEAIARRRVHFAQSSS